MSCETATLAPTARLTLHGKPDSTLAAHSAPPARRSPDGLQPDLHSHQTGTKGIQVLVEIDHTLWILGQGITAKDALSAVHAILGDVPVGIGMQRVGLPGVGPSLGDAERALRYPNCAASRKL